jgi:hypothetical protein
MDNFKMNSHAGIAYKLWFSLKGHPKLHTGYFEMTLHVGIAFKVALHLRLPKSSKRYIKTNLNMGIAFRETQKYIYILPFGNISKLSSFIFSKKT